MDNSLNIKNISEADRTYNYSNRITKKLNGILVSTDISKTNKELIIKFLKACKVEDLSNARLDFYIDKLKIISKLLNKDLDKCISADIEKLLLKLNERYEKSETRKAYIVTIKKFYRWLTKKEDPKIISWIKIKNYSKNAKQVNEETKVRNVLTPEEIESMISCTRSPRDRALVGCLYYGAFRIGELLGSKIKDIEFLEQRTCLHVYGKTGYRPVPINECTGLLKSWLEFHPDKNNKDAYLWISFNDVNRICNLTQFKHDEKPLTKINSSNHIGVRFVEMLLKELGEKAGIDKKTNPHNLRHSRLTYLGIIGLKDDMIKVYSGHSKNSRITSQYTHFSKEDLNNAISKLQGLKVEEKTAVLKKCYRCNHLNRNTLSICENCGLSLDVKEGLNIDKNKTKHIAINKALGVMLDDPVFKKALARYFLDRGMIDTIKQLAEDEN